MSVISVSLFRFIQRSRKEADVSNASTIAAAVQTALNETEIKNECKPHMATGFIVWAKPGQPFQAFPGVAGPGNGSLFVSTLNQHLNNKAPEIKYTKNNAESWVVAIGDTGVFVYAGDSSGVSLGTGQRMFPTPTGDYVTD